MTILRNMVILLASQVCLLGWLAGCVWLGENWGAWWGVGAFFVPVMLAVNVVGAFAMEAGVGPFGGLPPMPPPYPPPPPPEIP